MFQMIRNTHALAPRHTVVAYSDNSSVMEGGETERWLPEGRAGGRYQARREPVHVLMKVETHNHPTAISPFAGAATGAGGEIRDEGATGRGSKPKAGLTGFSVSNLHLPALPGLSGPATPTVERTLRKPGHTQARPDHDRGPARGAPSTRVGRPHLAVISGLRADGRRPRRAFQAIMIAAARAIAASQTAKVEFPPAPFCSSSRRGSDRQGVGARLYGPGANADALDFDSVHAATRRPAPGPGMKTMPCARRGQSDPCDHDVGAAACPTRSRSWSTRAPRRPVDRGAIPVGRRPAPKDIWCTRSGALRAAVDPARADVLAICAASVARSRSRRGDRGARAVPWPNGRPGSALTRHRNADGRVSAIREEHRESAVAKSRCRRSIWMASSGRVASTCCAIPRRSKAFLSTRGGGGPSAACRVATDGRPCRCRGRLRGHARDFSGFRGEAMRSRALPAAALDAPARADGGRRGDSPTCRGSDRLPGSAQRNGWRPAATTHRLAASILPRRRALYDTVHAVGMELALPRLSVRTQGAVDATAGATRIAARREVTARSAWS